ncbi:MAG: DUF885 family protein [Fimbriimonadaceae bacterium]|nr:DUF885 family protein [Fimbriimonadaceae bacterium]QYK57715.1 MAG: DUF885 family protein [Fimbriimonadaceae bacterium]
MIGPALVLWSALVGNSPMTDTVIQFEADLTSLNRFYAWPADDATRARWERFADDQARKLSGVPFESLDLEGKVDWILLRSQIEVVRERARFEADRGATVAKWLPFQKPILELERARVMVQEPDPPETAAVLDSIKAQADKVRQDSENRPSPTLALRAAKRIDRLGKMLDQWFKHYDGFKPEFSWWCRKPFASAKSSLEALEKTFREEVAQQKGEPSDPLVGDPIGRDALMQALRREFLDTTPEKLIEIARHEEAWCLQELKKAARELGHGDDWRKAMEQVKGLHAPVGGQDLLVAEQAREAIEFVRDLVTIDPLCEETWRVDMIDEAGQKTFPFAAYGGQRMLVSYPTEGMDLDTKTMSFRGNNRHFTRAITQHELIPGHHLQGYMAQRHARHRMVFSTPFFIEGWALYWEMLLWDLGFAKAPEDRIGMLFWRLHRCARIVVSLRFHLGEMSPQEMVDYLVDNVGHERWTATGEVRRFIGEDYGPLYQCAYMIGGLQLRGFNKALVPGTMTHREFHDRVLRMGSIPMALVGVSLGLTKPERDFKAPSRIPLSDEKP